MTITVQKERVDLGIPSTFKSEALAYNAKRIKFWDEIHSIKPSFLGGCYRQLLAAVYQRLIPTGQKILELGCGKGDLLAGLKPSHGVGIDFSEKAIAAARAQYPRLHFILGDIHAPNLSATTFDYIILSDVVNDIWDVQEVLQQLAPYTTPQTRIICNFYSHLWSAPLGLGRSLGLANKSLPQNWLTKHDLDNLFNVAGYETLQHRAEIIAPFPATWLTSFCNRYLAKLWPFHFLALANFIIARPKPVAATRLPIVSVIIAARNEEGHIHELISRIPEMGAGTEIIFVEGNSKDNTYATIEEAIRLNPHRDCKLYKQQGKGKGDAVRLGFDKAKGDILLILDADITVPPEDLPRFVNLLSSGVADFANGVRLVYPMNDEAMRFMNLVGNKFFSWAFSFLLGQSIRDTLCGTKVLWKKDYDKIVAGRHYFGDFDPFGDFDLLFGAAKQNLKIMDVPVRYRARQYGETNISRWRHGFLLLTMVIFAARRIKFV